jgi:hypothetical protein
MVVPELELDAGGNVGVTVAVLGTGVAADVSADGGGAACAADVLAADALTETVGAEGLFPLPPQAETARTETMTIPAARVARPFTGLASAW